MNLAIIVTISSYKSDTFCDIEATEKDFEYISNLFDKTKKYHDILKVHTSIKSSALKEMISEFLNKYADSDINEILFYFSGHGYKDENDFYYCVTYSNVNKIASTSISSIELDTIIGQYRPKRFIKIVDACQSGINYIKGANDFSANKERFNDCYFVFSSGSLEKSIIDDDNISHFTKKLLKAIYSIIITNNHSSITFSDLSGTISDLFKNDSNQTPKIVYQMNCYDEFIKKNNDLVEYLKSIKPIVDKVDSQTIIDDSKLPTEKEALNFKENIITDLIKLLNNKKYQLDILKQYKYLSEFEYISNNSVVKASKIGEWIKENKEKSYLFAEPIYKERYIGNPFEQITNILNRDMSKYEKYIDSFKPLVDEEHSCININFISNESSVLPKFIIQLVGLFNANKLYLFTILGYSVPKNWNEYGDLQIKDKIRIDSFIIKNNDYKQDLKNVSNDILNYCNTICKNYIQELEIVTDNSD